MGMFPKCSTTSTIFAMISLFLYSSNAEGEEIGPQFIFGDSLVDVGNNNCIVTLAKANVPPNGIDFGSPTGRFTNGRTVVDIIGQELGLKTFIPAYLDPATKGDVIMEQGVNYASGGSGILNETGQHFIGRLNMDAQLDNFANTRQDLMTKIGENAASEFLDKAMFSVNIGSNDFINNYLLPIDPSVKQTVVSPEAFVNSMISKYKLQLTRLRNMGAKKIVVINVGPIGCIPNTRDLNPSAGDDCVAFANQLAQTFNARLKTLVSELSNNLPGSQFVYADAYHIFIDLLVNYVSYGFENANSACCSVSGKFGGLVPCQPSSRVCKDRSKYVFWDPYHPSDAANVIIGKSLIDGDASVISPVNIRQLIRS